MNVEKLDFSLTDIEYHFIYTSVMQTLQLITAANTESAVYRKQCDAVNASTIEPQASAAPTISEPAIDSVSMLIEGNIGVIALILEKQSSPLVKFFISDIQLFF